MPINSDHNIQRLADYAIGWPIDGVQVEKTNNRSLKENLRNNVKHT